MDVLQRPVPQTPMGPAKLAVGVEESRAKRHQRQQNRFRDRGGIFKPTNRSTLVDILMGRRAPSPRKSMRRSASRSPSKRKKTPSGTKNNIGAVNTSNKDQAPQNGHVSPKKAPCKPKLPVAPKKSDLGEENREVPNAESVTKEVPSGSTLKETRAVAKQRKRAPKQQDSTDAENMQRQSSKSKPKRKTSKSKTTTRKRQTKSKASSADKAVASNVEIKSKSRLCTIPEEAEKSDADDERPKNTNRVRGKRKDAEKNNGGTFKGTRVANNGNENAATLGKGEKVVAASTQPVKKGKTLSSGSAKETSSSLDHSDIGKQDGHRQQTKGTKGSEPVEKDYTDAGKSYKKTAEVSPPTRKESEPPKSLALSAHRKRQMPDPSNDDAEAESLGRDVKRVRPRTTENKSGKQKHDKPDVANAPVPTCQRVDSVAQVADTSKGASHYGSIKRGSTAMSEVKSKKRVRSPEDSSAADLSLSKRAKIGKTGANLKVNRIFEDSSVESGIDRNALIMKAVGKPKLKENAVTSKSPPKQAAKISKSRTMNKRNKGLPLRVLQRLKNSEPHLVDDEPDPIDFLS